MYDHLNEKLLDAYFVIYERKVVLKKDAELRFII